MTQDLSHYQSNTQIVNNKHDHEIRALADPFINALKFPKPQNTTQPVGHLKIKR